MDFDSKLTFHLPRFNVDSEKVIALDYFGYREELLNAIQEFGDFYILSEIKKQIKDGKEFDVELITLYCNSEISTKLQNLFLEITLKHLDELQTKEFYLEKDDIFINVVVGDKDQ